MKCIWEPLLLVLPPGLRGYLQTEETAGLKELRLREGKAMELNYGTHYHSAGITVSGEDLRYILNAASRYSPWTAATAVNGYLTIPGGHRIGLCGELVMEGPEPKGFRAINGMCIRIARDIMGLAEEMKNLEGSVLILGAPGWGKTTLLRDLSREMAGKVNLVVVDERGELFPNGFVRGKRMDVLQFCPKYLGIEMSLKTMGPEIIAVDEITSQGDCEALMEAANCGVRLLATAHGSSLEDLQKRKIYRHLLEKNVFDHILLLSQDKTVTWERMRKCQ